MLIMYKTVIVTIREVLEKKEVFSGWLYLPDTAKSWSLNTQGIFVEEDIDADPNDPYPPAILDSCNLTESLDAAGIEDIISNAEAQTNKPSIDQLFKAFLFYLENDAFIDFKA
jgi:hypothetical protein